MGRGSFSNRGGGSGGGAVEIKDIENTALKTMMQDITMRMMGVGRYSNAMSVRDGKTLDKNTGVGDEFSHGPVTYRKATDGTWFEVGNNHTGIESDGMARIIAGLTNMPGTWKYKKKR